MGTAAQALFHWRSKPRRFAAVFTPTEVQDVINMLSGT